MLGFTATTFVHVALLAATSGDYQEAYQRAEEEGKPLLILVGTDWCPGCRTMKEEIMPEVRRAGIFRQVVFTQVDADAKPTLCRRLLRGNSIPQLVLYSHIGKHWRRVQLTGVHTPDEVQRFLKREIAAGRAEAKEAERQGAINVGSNSGAPLGTTTALR